MLKKLIMLVLVSGFVLGCKTDLKINEAKLTLTPQHDRHGLNLRYGGIVHYINNNQPDKLNFRHAYLNLGNAEQKKSIGYILEKQYITKFYIDQNDDGFIAENEVYKTKIKKRTVLNSIAEVGGDILEDIFENILWNWIFGNDFEEPDDPAEGSKNFRSYLFDVPVRVSYQTSSGKIVNKEVHLDFVFTNSVWRNTKSPESFSDIDYRVSTYFSGEEQVKVHNKKQTFYYQIIDANDNAVFNDARDLVMFAKKHSDSWKVLTLEEFTRKIAPRFKLHMAAYPETIVISDSAQPAPSPEEYEPQAEEAKR